MKADLHIHSTISDGSDDIFKISELALSRGLDVIAITEHDTLVNCDLINQVHNLKIVIGAELSAEYKSKKTRAHLLAYKVKNTTLLNEYMQPLLDARNRNCEKQVNILIEQGFDIDLNKLQRADNKYLYKQHIMDYLVKSRQVKEMFGDFYQNTFKNNGYCDFDIEYFDIFEAITAVKSTGGLAVLAHPGQQQNFWMIQELIDKGLDGIELNHPSHSKKDRKIINELASRFNLFLCGGSDYHGKFDVNPTTIGSCLSENSGIQAIC